MNEDSPAPLPESTKPSKLARACFIAGLVPIPLWVVVWSNDLRAALPLASAMAMFLWFLVALGTPLASAVAFVRILKSKGGLTGIRQAIAGFFCSLAGGFVCVVLLAPGYIRAPTLANRNACIANLLQIDGAKQQWAMEHQKLPADIPGRADLEPYLKDRALPVCPVGGVYTFNTVSAKPACSQSASGHTY